MLHVCSIAMSAALLASCGGSGLAPAPATAPGGSASWMRAGVTGSRALLYVSDAATNDVYVYDYGSGTPVGKLTGFHGPSGQCVDANGDVYIANFRGRNVVEYAHGGSDPIKTLATAGYPIGCSVSPSGDLAVTNFYSKTGAGSVQIFKNARGTPAKYTDPSACYYMWPAGYDNAGNLFVEGETTTTSLCWLPAGGSAMNATTFDQGINFPGSVMWDGKFLTLSDQAYGGYQTAVYQVVSSRNGALREVGLTTLADRCQSQYADVAQPFVAGDVNTPVNRRQGKTILGGNAWCGKRLAFWAYPGGGNPTASLAAAPAQPAGASVSIAAGTFARGDVSRAGIANDGAVVDGSKPCGWLSPRAKSGQPLAYVADGSYVWVFPENGLQNAAAAAIGCIDDGIDQAYGVTVDRHGKLYVVNRAGSVTAYKPGSLKPAATYIDSLSQPFFATVDAHDNLWVSNAGGGTVVEYLRGSIVAHRVLQTLGDEAYGLDFDPAGNLYVAYWPHYGNAGIEEFAAGSTQGRDLGIQLMQPQGLLVTKSGDLLVAETSFANRVDIFPAGKSAPSMEIGVPQTPMQLALTQTQDRLYVSSLAGTIYATAYPLRRSSVFRLNLTVLGGSVQGFALSNGESH